MPKQQETPTPRKYICTGLLAHVDSGKTTLAEGLLYRAGALRGLGRVGHRDACLDTAAQERFQNFLDACHGRKLVVLELGIGWRNQLIKAPLMRLVANEPNAAYVTINLGEVYIADDIKEKAFGLDGSLEEQLSLLRKSIQN